jgi:hypothetical protein
MLRFVLPLVFLAACASGGVESPTTPSVNEEFTLRPGQTAAVTGTALRITFEAVRDDSRCPTDVTCIWEGDATVVLKVKVDSDEAVRELHTNEGGERSRKVPAGDFTITLQRLDPAPRSTQPIEASAYRATLKVARE